MLVMRGNLRVFDESLPWSKTAVKKSLLDAKTA